MLTGASLLHALPAAQLKIANATSVASRHLHLTSGFCSSMQQAPKCQQVGSGSLCSSFSWSVTKDLGVPQCH